VQIGVGSSCGSLLLMWSLAVTRPPRDIVSTLRTPSPAPNGNADAAEVLQRQLQPNPDQAVEWPGARSLSSKAAPPVIYTPGSIEAAWSNITSHVCEAARRQASSHEVHHWLQFAKTSHGPTPRSPGPEEAAVLSHLTDVSSGCTEPIEPLTGTTRHPIAGHLGCFFRQKAHVKEVDVNNISFLVLSNHCGERNSAGCLPIGGGSSSAPSTSIPAPRRLLFDLGCAQYGMNWFDSTGGAQEGPRAKHHGRGCGGKDQAHTAAQNSFRAERARPIHPALSRALSAELHRV
jgi:hypothetical protein